MDGPSAIISLHCIYIFWCFSWKNAWQRFKDYYHRRRNHWLQHCLLSHQVRQGTPPPPPSGYRVFQFGIYVVKDLMTLPPRCQNKCENYGMKIWEVSSLGTLNNQSCVNIFFRKFEILLLGSYRPLSRDFILQSFTKKLHLFIFAWIYDIFRLLQCVGGRGGVGGAWRFRYLQGSPEKQPPKPKQVFFLRECCGNSAEEFRNFDGIANFWFG